FQDLIIAFKQDLHKNRYYNLKEILEYCKNSANPIGRILLCITKLDTPSNLLLSDKICTSLQLINFLQDLEADIQTRDRLYLPLADFDIYKVSIEDLKNKLNNSAIQSLINRQIIVAESLMKEGKDLGQKIKGLFGLELRLMINAGLCLIKKLKERTNIYERPIINFKDKIVIGLKSVLKI
ncbi:MAG: Phytoene synthase, partial [Francisellaceae bacterium]|nr:Phytoene synthase [Francisellaceae bacterium]